MFMFIRKNFEKEGCSVLELARKVWSAEIIGKIVNMADSVSDFVFLL